MPRKEWVPRCVYAKRSKLNNEEFCTLLMCWIDGDTADKTAALLMRMYGTKPSEKTVNTYFKRIADRVFEIYAQDYRQMAESNDGDIPDMDDFFKSYHEDATVNPTYDLDTSRLLHVFDGYGIAVVDFEAVKLEYRSVSIAKRGVAQRIKQTLAWATIREDGRSKHRAKYKKLIGIDEDIQRTIYFSLLEKFIENPC